MLPGQCSQCSQPRLLLTQQLQPIPLLLPPLAKTLGFVLQPVDAGDGSVGVRRPVAFLEGKRGKNDEVTLRDFKSEKTVASSFLLLLSEELLWITEAQHCLDSALLRRFIGGRGEKRKKNLSLSRPWIFFSLSEILTVQERAGMLQ